MMIPRNERKRIINDFVTQIMKSKLRVPDEYWRIEYTPRVNHPTSYVKWVETEDSGNIGIEVRLKKEIIILPTTLPILELISLILE